MMRLAGTEIFWTTLLVLFAILALSTLIGRLWAHAFPSLMRPAARFYLAPVLGLATLTTIVSNFGRHLALGNTILVPAAAVALIMVAFWLEKDRSEARHQLIFITSFAIICGTSVLAPLYVYGAFNAHNDAFTYLAQGNWLQDHAFSDAIPPDRVTPSNSQIALYQRIGLRMGASFLLAFFQGLLNLKWSSGAYPALAIAGVSASCLAIGFPLARRLRFLRLEARLALLALPALSVGGLVFGANYGFLAQTFGLAFGAGALFAAGPLLRTMVRAKVPLLQMVLAAFPVALLITAAIFSYSEIAPFLSVSIGASGLLVASRFGSWRNVMLFGISLALTILLFSNVELLRAYSALLTQASVVVGSPVDWSPASFLLHGIGIRAGAWESDRLSYFGYAWAILFGIIFVILSITSKRGFTIESLAVVPTLTILLIFSAAFFYFRYGVASPFPIGVGQSWSQFKLSEWAHPFLSLIFLAGVCSLLSSVSPRTGKATLAVVALAVLAAGGGAIARAKPLMAYYSDVKNLDAFYISFRRIISESCPPLAPIYLKLSGPHQKFREMAVLYLGDRVLKSDWTDDDFIYPWLQPDQRKVKLDKGDCLIEPLEHGRLNPAIVVGQFQMETFDGQNRLLLSSSSGDYGSEGTSENRWWWVRQSARFSFEPLIRSEGNPLLARITFGYRARTNQTLTVEIGSDDSFTHKFIVKGEADQPDKFGETIQIASGRPVVVRISTDGTASTLGTNDPRLAAFVVENLSVAPLN